MSDHPDDYGPAADETASQPEPLIFRQPWVHWAVLGMLGVLGAGVYAGTPLSDQAAHYVGSPALMAGFLALIGGGALCLMLAAVLYLNWVTVSETAVDLVRVGHPSLHLPWEDLERVVLHKSQRRKKGMVELWGRGRSLRLDPAVARFDELEAIVLAAAERVGAKVVDYRS